MAAGRKPGNLINHGQPPLSLTQPAAERPEAIGAHSVRVVPAARARQGQEGKRLSKPKTRAACLSVPETGAAVPGAEGIIAEAGPEFTSEIVVRCEMPRITCGHLHISGKKACLGAEAATFRGSWQPCHELPSFETLPRRGEQSAFA